MKERILFGLVLLAVIWVLVLLYNLAPALQGWVVFGAMAGMGMSLSRGLARARGGTGL